MYLIDVKKDEQLKLSKIKIIMLEQNSDLKTVTDGKAVMYCVDKVLKNHGDDKVCKKK